MTTREVWHRLIAFSSSVTSVFSSELELNKSLESEIFRSNGWAKVSRLALLGFWVWGLWMNLELTDRQGRREGRLSSGRIYGRVFFSGNLVCLTSFLENFTKFGLFSTIGLEGLSLLDFLRGEVVRNGLGTGGGREPELT